MKKVFLIFLIASLFFPILAHCETGESWDAAPIITQAYEISSGKLYLEWTGNASVYQVYLDGKSVASVIVNNAVISITKGTHTIYVYPIDEIKDADTKIDIGLGSDKIEVLNLDLGIDLAMIGIDPKKLVSGTPSDPLTIDYSPNTILNAKPDQFSATTDEHDRVLLSFSDRYYADEYIVSIKTGNDINYVKFAKDNPAANGFINQHKNIITLTLDPTFLETQECIIPELEGKYTFTIQLRKYAENMSNGEKILSVVHQSKESNNYTYTPVAAWKNAPTVSYASQTADGEITLQWEHDNFGVDCDYAIVKLNKTLGLTTGEEAIGVTKGHRFTIKDLMNGTYAYAVYPVHGNEKGSLSNESNINVQNEWVAAPILTCESIDTNCVRLKWTATNGVERYHILVYKGDNNSLLRFIDMDYSKCDELIIPANLGEMEAIYKIEDEIDPEKGIKLKFEIYGIRLTEQEDEQKTATTTSSITIGIN